MNEETKILFEELKKEVTWCHYYWIIYRQIYGTNESRIKIINKTTPSVFVIIQNLFNDYITLEISKLTDPAKIGKHNNLSFSYLLLMLEGQMNNNKYKELQNKLDLLILHSQKFRDRRNKLVTHKDLLTVINEGINQQHSFSRKDVEDTLKLVREFLNEIELHFYNSQTLYEEFITDLADDGTALLIILAKSLAYDDLTKKPTIPERLWENYGKVFE